MKNIFDSKVEQAFYELSGVGEITTKIPYVEVDNFPKLGLMTSLRFLEWADQNPQGVISLPTGKTPEYFIKYTQYLLENWNNNKGLDIRSKYGLGNMVKPDLRGLEFVQIDEFYPINPAQHNSFYNYVMNYYIKGFGLEEKNSLLINSNEIPLVDNKHFLEVFPDYNIDLSLRYRDAKSVVEEMQQKSIFMIDNWCTEYEHQIREKGGIGFFLGGIGPDGHIAFNTRGSDHYSTTRLTKTNFETQAVAAGDLGGIEVSRNRLVITIGLDTITHNPDAVSIIFAAGEAKADIVKGSLESAPDAIYPATVLQRQKNSRFYLTTGAACKLTDSVNRYYKSGDWTHTKTEKSIIDLCNKSNTYGHHLTLEDLKADPYTRLIPNLNENTVQSVIDSIKKKLEKGMKPDVNEVIYHTGPHHDDIMLGIMPYTNRQMRSASNEIHFSVLTSGFTAVTNRFVIDVLKECQDFIANGKIEMLNYPDFFELGYTKKWDKDVYHFLNSVADRNTSGKRRGLCHRLVRAIVDTWKVTDKANLDVTIKNIIDELESSYDGGKNSPEVQRMKGMIREFEEELVWAHFGTPVKNIHHLRLGFYKGDVFTETPEKNRDMLPVLEEFRKYKPTTISLAMDPEGSGPDTHYKVLQAIAGAVKEWKEEADLSNLRIIGYRNVWFKYHPADADTIVPVSLNALDVLENSFTEAYMSQVNASFPSYEYDGKFNELTQKVWVNQLKQIQMLLGKNFFYENNHPLVRATHGLVYMKEMNADEFVAMAQDLEKAVEENPF
ncbi:glucosamine-6-phosphate isomerase [Ancylomarina salipaludis]|uniref:Glucosamine-6-phosphate isomerase n=1 Tax=Ancylomarina salipaludis TaxID=2501299 RepID=A0A4Q1JRP9_9BACT|nr:glucosamine-6-phosphate isomerase [Ancylomarina salipaludis]RXQ97465.1 glucosamine-6-phosphate isomerase [Ancylomarina salipaludis]